MRRLLLFFIVLLLTIPTYAESTIEPIDTPTKDSPLSVLEGEWVFSGRVVNEDDEAYSYYFQLERHHTHFYTRVILMDIQQQDLLFSEENEAIIESPQVNHWQVGSTFLEFNPITNSWIFGTKTKDKTGFNFKIDMLEQAENLSIIEKLRPGMKLLINQTGTLNGDLQIRSNEKEQFVTAEKSWFRQIWSSELQPLSTPWLSILCQFNDGSGLFVENIHEQDAIKGSIAGWRNSEGSSIPISQFISVDENKKGDSVIRIPAPRMNLVIKDRLNDKSHSFIAGFSNGLLKGFCTIANNKNA